MARHTYLPKALRGSTQLYLWKTYRNKGSAKSAAGSMKVGTYSVQSIRLGYGPDEDMWGLFVPMDFIESRRE